MKNNFIINRISKRLGAVIAVLALMFLISSCGKQNNNQTSSTPDSESMISTEVSVESSNDSDNTSSEKTSNKKTVTVTTSFLNDMVKQLAGDFVDINLIIPAGEDPHLYVAQPNDLTKIEEADLLLYHGLHFEGKMVDVLEKKGHAVSIDFPKDDIGEMEEDGHMVIDPHFWFSIDLYKLATKEASKQLRELLPEHAEEIEKNESEYLASLDSLDKEIKEKLETIPQESRYLVTPHDAFNYFSRAYNITVVAPQGVSTDSEVANADIDKTVDFIIEHKIKAVFAESTTNPERMEKLKEICSAKGWDIEVVSGEGRELFSDSLAPMGEFGDNYIDMYRHNVSLMVEHLK